MDAGDIIIQSFIQGFKNAISLIIHSSLIWIFLGVFVFGIIIFIIKRKINKK